MPSTSIREAPGMTPVESDTELTVIGTESSAPASIVVNGEPRPLSGSPLRLACTEGSITSR